MYRGRSGDSTTINLRAFGSANKELEWLNMILVAARRIFKKLTHGTPILGSVAAVFPAVYLLQLFRQGQKLESVSKRLVHLARPHKTRLLVFLHH